MFCGLEFRAQLFWSKLRERSWRVQFGALLATMAREVVDHLNAVRSILQTLQEPQLSQMSENQSKQIDAKIRTLRGKVSPSDLAEICVAIGSVGFNSADSSRLQLKKKAEKDAKKRQREAEKEEAARKREEERTRRKEEAEEERNNNKYTKDNETFCAKALGRIAPMLSNLELLTSSPKIRNVPAHVKGDATSSQKVLTKMQTEAKSKLDGSSATSFSIEDLDNALQTASDAHSALKDMLKSVKS